MTNLPDNLKFRHGYSQLLMQNLLVMQCTGFMLEIIFETIEVFIELNDGKI